MLAVAAIRAKDRILRSPENRVVLPVAVRFISHHTPSSPMGQRSLAHAVVDLERAGRLIRIEQEIDPHLEAAEIHRRVYQTRGPAVFFARVKGTRFPMVSNLFGTLDRAKFLFRDALDD